MKKQGSLKNILGLTQEEAAVYFGVTPGHWSMIAIGKRSLPLEGTIKLSNILQFLKDKKSTSETRLQIDKSELEKVYDKLQQDYKSTIFKLYNLDKKINRIESTRADCFAALDVADYLESQKNQLFADGIRLRVKDTLKKNDLYALTELQLKKESLEVFKVTLDKKIKAFEK